MQYSYYFEIASVIFMLLLLAVLLIQRNFELAKGRSFFVLILISVIESIMNVVSSWGLGNTNLVSSTANWWLCFVFFIAEAFTSLIYFHYVVILCEASRAKRTVYAVLALIPFAAFLIMILLTKPFHLIYTVENNVYSQGTMAWYGYAYIMLYLVASLIVAVTAKRTIRGRNRYAVIVASLISLAAIVLQYFYKEMILTGISNAIIIYVFYILIQNPNELKDKVSTVQNARAFVLRFESLQNQEKHIKILTVDIHQQNQINALFGYRNGNVILGEVGEFLGKLAGEKNVYHISNNVFAIVAKDDASVERYKNAIYVRFDMTWELESIETMVAVNLGLIRVPEDAKTINEFYGVNNFLKHIIRKDALNNYIEMTPELSTQYSRSAEVERALQKAIANNSIQVYFQPIYEMRQKAYTSLEALARLYDDELGFVAPDEFIATAENNGMIVQLDLMILDKTCEFIEKEILPKKELQIESVHINVSVMLCMQKNMDTMVLSIIDRYHVPREMIMIEITERATVTAAELMEQHMVSLKKQGVSFALDDYGTGNSNCSYLIDYPFDKVKFDKNMVWAYFSSDTGKIILSGEMQTIHQLNIPIVAEGIEELEQLEAMHRLGVEYIQGYYYSKPMPGDKLIEFLEK